MTIESFSQLLVGQQMLIQGIAPGEEYGWLHQGLVEKITTTPTTITIHFEWMVSGPIGTNRIPHSKNLGLLPTWMISMSAHDLMSVEPIKKPHIIEIPLPGDYNYVIILPGNSHYIGDIEKLRAHFAPSLPQPS